MPVAIAIGAASVIGAGASIISGNKAARAQRDAANQSIAEQRRVDDLNRAENAPFRDTGVKAIDKLASLYGVQRDGGTYDSGGAAYGGFEATPGYQWRRDEGMRGLDRGLAARGLLSSAAAVKSKMRYGDGLASAEYENFANHLAGLAGVGQTATAQNAASSTNAANNISDAYLQAGNARASAYMNTGAAINNGLQNLAGIYSYGQGGGFNIPSFGRRG